MKLHAVRQARVMWLFPTDEINPQGKYFLPLLMELTKRYNFANIPDVAAAMKKNAGIVLEHGSYTYGTSGDFQIDLGIYNDGLVGDTKSDTDISDSLLNDVLAWLKKEHSFAYPTDMRKTYASKLHFEVSGSLNSLNAKLEKFSKAISSKSQYFGKVDYELGGLNFVAQQVGPLLPQVFRFEREENRPFSSNRYYSFAAMPTKDHIALIEQLEQILS